MLLASYNTQKYGGMDPQDATPRDSQLTRDVKSEGQYKSAIRVDFGPILDINSVVIKHLVRQSYLKEIHFF